MDKHEITQALTSMAEEINQEANLTHGLPLSRRLRAHVIGLNELAAHLNALPPDTKVIRLDRSRVQSVQAH